MTLAAVTPIRQDGRTCYRRKNEFGLSNLCCHIWTAPSIWLDGYYEILPTRRMQSRKQCWEPTASLPGFVETTRVPGCCRSFATPAATALSYRARSRPKELCLRKTVKCLCGLRTCWFYAPLRKLAERVGFEPTLP